jgi:hypothetical protein
MDVIKIFDDTPQSYLLWSFDDHNFVEVEEVLAGRQGEGATNSLPS